jgi:type VI secretion system secreted protein Hcp
MSFQYYVSVKGKKQGQFKPESTKAGRKDKFVECLSFNMGSSVPYDANSGHLRGYRQHDPLTITKEWGASSPQFLQAHWTNEVLDEVVLEIVARTDDGSKEFVLERITLTDAVVVTVKRYSATSAKDTVATDVHHLEDISFRFRQIMVENPNAGTSTTDNWDAPGT